ncbi:MAG: adenine deaminase [Bacillota bacterium]|nr:adenine deaminase [Bacillota bacterium]
MSAVFDEGTDGGLLLVAGGQVVDVFTGEIYHADVLCRGPLIVDVIRQGARPAASGAADATTRPGVAGAPRAPRAPGAPRAARAALVDARGGYVLPGLINGHLHVESSLVTPCEYAAAVLPRGTTTLVADPHEIANVLGESGVRHMLEMSLGAACDFFFAAPSCVPATPLETAGASVGTAEIERLLAEPRVVALGEMMNYPAVIAGDPDVLAKLALARRAGKPADGHAPGLRGEGLARYAAAGITSDHESTTLAEAEEKMRLGMWIMVREGSAARNLAALAPLAARRRGERMMLVTDDRHPDDLLCAGELDHVLRLAVASGVSPVDAVRMATLNPAIYFGLRDRGLVAPGRVADLWVAEDLACFRARAVVKSGRLAGAGKHPRAPCVTPHAGSTVHFDQASLGCLDVPARRGRARVIGIVPGQIVTRNLVLDVEIGADGRARSGDGPDLAWLTVIERHGKTKGRAGLGLIAGMGLRAGAIGSSVAHDSHNLVVAGAAAADIRFAAGELARLGGGFVAVRDGKVLAALPLPVAGLMSDLPVAGVASMLGAVNAAARSLGCPLDSPFMTLSFMALPVIPELKLTDRGLVDVGRFAHVPLWLAG